MEHSAGGVLFTRRGKERLYVVVTEHDGHTGLPKGHLEAGETAREAALREIREETGVKATIIAEEALEETYALPRGGEKRVTYFLARFDGGICADDTQVKRAELLPLREALALLTFDGARQILRQADQRLDELGQ